MAVYTSYQSVLDNVLGDYRSQGFSLQEPDTHILELCYQGKVIARFLQTRAAISVIRDTCEGHLKELGTVRELKEDK